MTQQPKAGHCFELAPGICRILAPNPSPMTYWGTNSYVIGQTTLAVIDPGPADDQHKEALMQAVQGRPVAYVIVTHSHLDHAPLAAPLAKALGAPVVGFGPSDAGRSPVMQRLIADGYRGGGEGVDPNFAPDICLSDGAQLRLEEKDITALHTPGHMGNHLCLLYDQEVFTGDLVMGWASTMVSPPDGDLDDYLASCERLKGLNAKRFYPAHGAPINDPAERLGWLLDHRNARTKAILAALKTGPQDVASLTRAIYHDVAPEVLPAASRNVFAHLVSLSQSGVIEAIPSVSEAAVFKLARS